MISKEYISKTSFPELIRTNTGEIAILMNSNEYESEIYTIDEINSVINKSKNNCDFTDTFNKYFFKNNSDSKIFKDFYLAFLFGNMENFALSRLASNPILGDDIIRQPISGRDILKLRIYSVAGFYS